MSSVPKLVFVIPADAAPKTDIDLRALCAPPGTKAPAHLRLRFETPDASEPAAAPPPLPTPPVVADATPSPAPAPAPDEGELVIAARSAAMPMAEPSSPLVEEDIDERPATRRDDEPVTLDPPTSLAEDSVLNAGVSADAKSADATYEEAAEDDGEAAPEPLPSAPIPDSASAEGPVVQAAASSAALAGTADHDTRALRDEVSRFVDETAPEVTARPAAPADDSLPPEPPTSLQGGLWSGFGNLITAVIVFVIGTTAIVMLYHVLQNRREDPSENVQISLNSSGSSTRTPEKPPEQPPEKAPETSPKAPDATGGAPETTSGGATRPEGPLEPTPETSPADPGPLEPEAAPEIVPEVGVGGLVGVESGEGEAYPGFAFGGEVGVEESEPGLMDRIEGLRKKARGLEDAGKPVEALATWQELLALRPSDADALFRSGTLHYRMHADATGDAAAGHLARAEGFFRKVLEVEPDSSRSLNNYGLVLLALDRRDEARKVWQKAAAAANPDALANLGNDSFSEGSALAAADFYRKALQVAPEHPEARLGLGLSIMADDEEQAVELFKAVASEAGVAGRAHTVLGDLAARQGDLTAARDHYDKALEAEPKNLVARTNRALVRLKLGQPEQARADLTLVLRERPKDAESWMNMGIALMALGRRLDAKRAYEYAIAVGPSTAEMHFNYGLCAESFGNRLIAIEEYEQALRRDRFFWRAAYNKGLIYLAGAKPEKALEDFNMAISIKGDYAAAHLGRAEALLALRRTAEAASALRSWLRVSRPDDPRRAEITATIDRIEQPSTSGQPRDF